MIPEQVQKFLQNNKPMLIVVGIVLVVGLVFLVYYQRAVFHITGVTPGNRNLPTSSRYIEVRFNKKLSGQNKATQVTLSPATRHVAKFENNKVLVLLDTPLEKDKELKVTIKDIAATDGDKITKEFLFKGKYVEFDKLSKEEQRRQVDSSDSFQSEYPLTSQLPVETLQYTISNRFPDTGDPRMPIIISMNFNIRTNPDTGLPTKANVEEYNNMVRQYRTEAIDLVKKMNGYDPAKYRFEFGENVLLNEFEGTYSGATN